MKQKKNVQTHSAKHFLFRQSMRHEKLLERFYQPIFSLINSHFHSLSPSHFPPILILSKFSLKKSFSFYKSLSFVWNFLQFTSALHRWYTSQKEGKNYCYGITSLKINIKVAIVCFLNFFHHPTIRIIEWSASECD